MKRPTNDFWKQIALLDQNLGTVTYYELLGLEASADQDELREAYERQIRVVHPDRHAREQDANNRHRLTRVYARIGEAFRVLSKPHLRSEYDGGLGSGRVRHRNSRADTHRGTIADPRHPQAKSLFEQAQALIARNELRTARSKLLLAKHYQKDSQAIQDAISHCDELQAPALSPPAVMSFIAAPERAADVSPDPPLAAEAEAERSHKDEAEVEPLPEISEEDEKELRGQLARLHARVPMGKSIQVTCNALREVTTLYMQNISRGGMLLRCDEQLPLGSVLDLAMKTPDREAIELPAEVVRHVAPQDEYQRPAMGVRFLVVPEEIRASFELLLSAAGIQPEVVEKPEEPAPELLMLEDSPADQALAETIEEAKRLIESGAPRDAIPMLQIAVHQYPDQNTLRATFHLAAGLTARQMGLEGPALHHFEQILRYDTNVKVALDHLREDES